MARGRVQNQSGVVFCLKNERQMEQRKGVTYLYMSHRPQAAARRMSYLLRGKWLVKAREQVGCADANQAREPWGCRETRPRDIHTGCRDVEDERRRQAADGTQRAADGRRWAAGGKQQAADKLETNIGLEKLTNSGLNGHPRIQIYEGEGHKGLRMLENSS
ncbi:hypothetical protein C8J57DRAFT_1329616 [Mycena rebaudengoi]|nr:hypothetical protein C8J57DRAFT_1329616 [Mycena rebaudengoi]